MTPTVAAAPKTVPKAATKVVALGDLLVSQGLLTPERLGEALTEQKRSGRLLGRVLVENGFVTEEQIARTLATQLGVPYIDLRRYEVNSDTVHALSEMQARRFRGLVLEDREDTYLVGMVDPFDLRAQDEIAALLKRPVDVALITNEQLVQTLDRVFRKTELIGEFAKEVEREIESDSDLQVVDLSAMDVAVDAGDAPVVRLLQTVFDDAVQIRASDIHFQPQEKSLEVRFRIDGVLHKQVSADPKIAGPLVVRLKLMAGLDIGEKRLPQDGRIAIKSGSRRLDVRMSVMPSQHGESVVLRLLMREGELIDLEKTGMPAPLFANFVRVLQSPHGIVLVTGPTGSGKTTTLYGALQRLNDPGVKILTCEDPVEYRIPGLVQVQINDKIELTFARVLRSFLRHDPDILLVGEIRDEETAEIAARAAMTGHLVLSTLHTNDSISTPARLLDMRVPGYLIASTLLAVVSQRLVRLNCRYCIETYSPRPDELEWVRHYAGGETAQAKFQRGKGCTRCNAVGYTGRTGVFEMIEMTAPLAAAIHGGDPREFERAAREQLGRNTVGHRALDLVLAGETTVAEAMQVVTSAEG
jgi:MSHA biogenesis protein MshE